MTFKLPQKIFRHDPHRPMLEGMPLGLELAATWINTLSCQEIAAEIIRGLDILELSQGISLSVSAV